MIDDKPADKVNLGASHVETSHSVIELPAITPQSFRKQWEYSTEFSTYQTDSISTRKAASLPIVVWRCFSARCPSPNGTSIRSSSRTSRKIKANSFSSRLLE